MLTSVLHPCRVDRVPRSRLPTTSSLPRAVFARMRTHLRAFGTALLKRLRALIGGGVDDDILDELTIW